LLYNAKPETPNKQRGVDFEWYTSGSGPLGGKLNIIKNKELLYATMKVSLELNIDGNQCIFIFHHHTTE
jgi:hypothetical protein